MAKKVLIDFDFNNGSRVKKLLNGNEAQDGTTVSQVNTAISGLSVPLTTLTGVPYNSTNLGTFTGNVISDNDTVKGALQDLETAQEIGGTEQHSVWFQDYLIPSSSALGWSSSSSGGGFGQSWESISDASNATGVVELKTGTGTTGRYALLSWNNALVFANETAYTFEARVNIQSLSTVSEEYKVTFGFSNKFNEAGGGSNETDYAYWIYRRTVDGDYWVAATARNRSETKTVTSTAPVGNDTTFVTLKIVVPADGSSVAYYIDGVQKASHESNIPQVTDRMGIGLRIDKTAGTTEREFRVDWHRFVTTRTAAR